MKQKLLILEDSHFFQQYYKKSFHAFDVHCVANGREALQWLLDGNLADGIIADLIMPVMDGLDFLLSFQQFFDYHIPTIMVSDETSNELIISCLEAGANDYVSKPFHPRILKIKLEKLVNPQSECNASCIDRRWLN